jgi:hypothetical protein
VPRYPPNKMLTTVKKRYFELIRSGMKGAAAARVVAVLTSCGSLWFLDAGGVIITEPRPISPQFLTQDDRIAIADGLRAGVSKKRIADQIGKSFQTIYREVRRNSKPDGTYQPWWAHNQAVLRRRRPKPVKLLADARRPPRLRLAARACSGLGRRREAHWSAKPTTRAASSSPTSSSGSPLRSTGAKRCARGPRPMPGPILGLQTPKHCVHECTVQLHLER